MAQREHDDVGVRDLEALEHELPLPGGDAGQIGFVGERAPEHARRPGDGVVPGRDGRDVDERRILVGLAELRGSGRRAAHARAR